MRHDLSASLLLQAPPLPTAPAPLPATGSAVLPEPAAAVLHRCAPDEQAGCAWPIALAWHERTCSVAAPGHFVIEIPYDGRQRPAGVDPHLTGALRARWRDRVGPWKVTAVAAAFGHAGSPRDVLRLAIAAQPTGATTARLDGVAMARDLRTALGGR